jgi:hypothetical protein
MLKFPENAFSKEKNFKEKKIVKESKRISTRLCRALNI